MKRGLSAFISFISLIIIIIGALNWGLWGFFQFDFFAWIFHGNANWSSRVVYAIIGLAGIWSVRFLGRCGAICCHRCNLCHKAPCACEQEGRCNCGDENCQCCKDKTCPCDKEGCKCGCCTKAK